MALNLLKESLEGIVALACASTVFLLAIADAPVDRVASPVSQAAPAAGR
jgi:hypothetical protein